LEPWHDPRGDLAQVLDLLGAEMERALSLTREYKAVLKHYVLTEHESPAEDGAPAEVAA
jgi:hypothetical protein